MSTTEKPQGGRPRGRPKTPVETLRKRGSWLAKKGTRRAPAGDYYSALPDGLRAELSPVHIEQLYTGSGGTPGTGYGPREVVTMLDESHGETSYSREQLARMRQAWERWREPLLDAYCKRRMGDPSWPGPVCPWAWWRFDHGIDFGAGLSERVLIRKKKLLAKIRAVYEPLFKASADVYAARRWLDAHLRGDGPEGFAL